MRKGFLFLTLSAFLLWPSLARAERFLDVPADHAHYEAIGFLAEAGWVTGYPDGTFKPEGTILRSEAVALLTKTLGGAEGAGGEETLFKDVRRQDWFFGPVAAAHVQGWVAGYSDGTFRPGQTLTFAEGLKLILSSKRAPVASAPFAETPLRLGAAEDWYRPYFDYADYRGLIDPVRFYHPAEPMTRGEFAEILYRFQEIQRKRLRRYSFAPAADDRYSITIPALGIFNVNVGFADPFNEKQALSVLSRGLGHYLASPGEGRKMVLFGHSSGYAWDASAFKNLLTSIDRLHPGDRIYINFHGRGYAYEVDRFEVIPASLDGSLMENPNEDVLALYTCWPPNKISHRYVVYSRPLPLP